MFKSYKYNYNKMMYKWFFKQLTKTYYNNVNTGLEEIIIHNTELFEVIIR